MIGVPVILAALLAARSPAPRQPPGFSRDVFPATAEHPRYSEGSLIVLRDGRLLLAVTEFRGLADHAPARIVARASADGGRAWGAPRVLQENTGRQNVMSVTLRRLRAGADGPIGLFYLVKNGPADLKVWLRVSRDEARSFGPARVVTAAPGYHVMNNDRVARLGSGRLLAPVATCPDLRRQNRFTSLVWISDDGGESWRASRGRVELPRRGAMEPEVVELETGRLLMLLRTQLGSIWASRSGDGGETWGEPFDLGVSSPEAPATLRRIPGSRDLLLVRNPAVRGGAGHGGPRTPLVASISRDGGRHWGPDLLLEKRADRAYAYTSLAFAGGRALLSYYVRDGATGRISTRFRSVPLAWLQGDRAPSGRGPTGRPPRARESLGP